MNKSIYIKIISLASVIVITFFLTPAFTNAAVIKSLKGDGLVAWWTMDHNKVSSRIFDSSGNNVNGYFINGATTTYPGKLGQALDFDGTNDYVNLTTGGLGDTGSLSISVWVRPDSLSSTGAQGCCTGGTIIEGDNTGGNTGYNFSIRNDGKIWVWGNGGNDIFSTGSVPTGSWTHITYVYTGGNAKIYFNGVLDSSQASSQPSGHSSHSRIGHQGWVVGYFDGLIDDLRIYNRALQPSEIPNIMRSTPTSANVTPASKTTNGLVGWWTMDGKDTLWSSATAGTVIDKSGNGNTGTMTYMNRTAAQAIGKIGQSLNFDGMDDHIDMGNPSSLNLSSVNRFTLSAWVYPTSAPDNAGLISEMYNHTNQTVQYEIGFDMDLSPTPGSSRLSAGFFDGSSWRIVKDTVNIETNKWTYVTGSWDGTTLRLYKNGMLASTTAPGGSLPSSNFDKVVIGKRHDVGGSVNFFPGKVDDVRIYNRALSDLEISQLYNSGVSNYNVTPPVKNTSSLVGWWTMDGKDTNWLNSTTGTTTDKSGNGNTGTFNNLNRSTSPVPGKIGQGIKFVSANQQYIDFGNPINTNDSVTFSSWVKFHASGEQNVIARGQDGSGNGWSVVLRKGPSNTAEFYVVTTSAGNAAYGVSSGSLSLNTWYHLTGVWTAGDSVKLYLNGVLLGNTNTTTTSLRTSGVGITIARTIDSNSVTYDVTVDDARVYNRALSATEILQLYNQGK